jgi:hypothetical protein
MALVSGSVNLFPISFQAIARLKANSCAGKYKTKKRHRRQSLDAREEILLAAEACSKYYLNTMVAAPIFRKKSNSTQVTPFLPHRGFISQCSTTLDSGLSSSSHHSTQFINNKHYQHVYTDLEYQCSFCSMSIPEPTKSNILSIGFLPRSLFVVCEVCQAKT